MSAYFDTDERRSHLVEIARGWLGTPFHPHAALRGVGVDCVHLLAEIYREAGLLGPYELPDYTMDGGDYQSASQVLSWLRASPRFQELPAGAAAGIGDLVTFRLGRVPHHVGLVIGPTFIHAIRDYGVIESFCGDPTYAKRRQATFRPLL